jgi:fused signal recognition particle receptor
MPKWFKRDKNKAHQDNQTDAALTAETEDSTVEKEPPEVETGDIELDDLDFVFEDEFGETLPLVSPDEEAAAFETAAVDILPEISPSAPLATSVEIVAAPEPEAAGSWLSPEEMEGEVLPEQIEEAEPEPHEIAGQGREQEEAVEEPGRQKLGFLARLKDRLTGTRAVLTTRVDHLLLGVREINEDVLDELEEILITADLGVKTTQALIKTISAKVARKELSSPDKLKETLRSEIKSMMTLPPPEFNTTAKPHVILVIGVNGVGKTTTIAKLAHRYVQQGRTVMLVAGDTFRAAAVEQLTIWSERVGTDIVKQQTGADPSAVVYDALEAAQARGTDIVIIDTAGRLHTKVNLMEELKKIKRVAEKAMAGAPHEILLVLDATTGQNAVSQARLFNEAVNVDHLAMTKLDGTAKGGVVMAIYHDLGLPISYVGLGENMDDLRDFEPEAFVEALFG